jgi:hypothetical protein
VIVVKLLAAAGLASLIANATPLPSPAPAPVYWGAPPVRFALESRPLGFDADGNARWLVVVRLYDASGRPTRIMENDNFDWFSSRGYLQWQTKLAYGNPAAIVRVNRDGPISIRVRANVPNLGVAEASTDTRSWHGHRVVASALGPHEIELGWFPQEQQRARIYRIGPNGTRRLLVAISGPSSFYRDTSVLPGRAYRYVLYRADHAPVRIGSVSALPPPPHTSLADVSGKGMWLYFSDNPLDQLYWRHLDPQRVVEQAARAGLHYIELRTAYGAYSEITPEAKPTIDAIIDGLAAHGIITVGWTVPRDTTFEDLQMTTRSAYYRTAKGTRLYALAPDVERGDEFLGAAPQGGITAIWQYVRDVRQAMGSHYIISPNVEDAYLEHLDNTKYPFAKIARFASDLQPMAYWRMMRRHPTTPEKVRVLLAASYAKLLREAGRAIPISIGGQTDADGPNGYPPASEITASLATAKRVGALGECFFAYDGTQPYQWSAMSAYPWPVR